jgi:hypothetical protein
VTAPRHRRFDDFAHARFVEIDSADDGFADREASGSCSSISPPMKH